MAERPQTILLYGETDTGKTVQLGKVAHWHWEKTGEVTRLISADSGWESINPSALWHPTENPDGFIEAWNVQGLPDPWGPWTAAVEGSWPHVVKDAQGKPKLRMKAPSFQDGKILASDGKRLVGQYMFEGLSTFGNTALQDHIQSHRVMGENVVGKFGSLIETETEQGGKLTVTPRTITLGKSAQSHYGHVQDFILLDLVPKSGSLPVSRVIWTAHEGKGTDEVTGIKDSALGPAVVGKATVNKTVQKFGHAFHLAVATSFRKEGTQQVIVREFRAWFVKHPDEALSKMHWPTKISLPTERSSELLRRFPGGYIPLTVEKGMEQFLDFLAEDRQDVQLKAPALGA